MAIRQYVGARYVPIFGRKDETSIEWDNSRPYEPLTIVLYEGNSYTSRQHVPAGVDIFDELFWANTGNYNAQVEQYRQEVGAFDSRITDNANAIADEVLARGDADLIIEGNVTDNANAISAIQGMLPNTSFDSTNTVAAAIASNAAAITELQNEIAFMGNDTTLISPYLQGTAVFVKNGDNAIIMDCGYTTDLARMTAFLNAQGVTRLDAVVITHFHQDHYGAFGSVADFMDDDTDLFIQMVPSGNENLTKYNNSLSTIQGVLSDKGLNVTPTTPSEGLVKTYGDISLRLNNTTLTNRAVYEATAGEGYGPVQENRPQGEPARIAELNNYSLVCNVDSGGFKIFYAGDLEAVGQRLNYSYIEPVDVAFTMHHLSSWWGYLPLYQRLAAKKWVGTTAISNFGANIVLNYHYLLNLIRYNYIDDLIITHNLPVEIRGRKGSMQIVQGESFIESMTIENLQATYTFITHILPPSYVTDNVYAIYDMTLAELVSACQYSMGGTYTATSGVNHRSDMLWFQDIEECMWGMDLTNYTITLSPSRVLRVQIHQGEALYSEMIVYGSVQPAAHKNYALVSRAHPFVHRFENLVSNNDNLTSLLSSDELNNLYRSEHAFVVLDSGLQIPLTRTSGVSQNATTPNFGKSALYGMMINSTMTNIYRVNISTAGLLTAVNLKLSDGTVADVTNVRTIGTF